MTVRDSAQDTTHFQFSYVSVLHPEPCTKLHPIPFVEVIARKNNNVDLFPKAAVNGTTASEHGGWQPNFGTWLEMPNCLGA